MLHARSIKILEIRIQQILMERDRGHWKRVPMIWLVKVLKYRKLKNRKNKFVFHTEV